MKTLVFNICLLTSLFSNSVSAQQDSLSAAHIGIMYPLSTNGKAAGQISNHFSLHLLSGYSKSEYGVSVSGLGNIIKEDANGLQIAGVVNQIGRNASGLQIAGVGNYVKDTASDLMLAGVYNFSSESNSQIAGVINIAKENVEAIQIAGVANIARKDVKGVQISGFLNKSQDVNSQIGGFLNIARNVKGVQVSGFLNIADSSDYPIGVINLIRNGEKGLGVFLDETMTTTITFRSGSRKFYSIIGVGYNERPSDDRYLAFEGGVGANWNFTPIFRLKGELVSRTLTQDFDDNTRHTASLRIMPSLKIANRIELFGGPSFNHTYYEKSDSSFPLPKKYLWTNNHYEDFHGLYLGWTVGVQVLF